MSDHDAAILVAQMAAASAADLAATTNRVIEYERQEARRWAQAYVDLYSAVDADPSLSRRTGYILNTRAHMFDAAVDALAGSADTT